MGKGSDRVKKQLPSKIKVSKDSDITLSDVMFEPANKQQQQLRMQAEFVGVTSCRIFFSNFTMQTYYMGISFSAAAIGMPRNPNKTLTNH